jgi:hypothetical protein
MTRKLDSIARAALSTPSRAWTLTKRQRTTSKALPFPDGTCYACRKPAVGYRDRKPEGGKLEVACKRHADPTVKVAAPLCIYCNAPVRLGSVSIDDDYAHAKCHRRESAW